MRIILSSLSPAILRHKPAASSSSVNRDQKFCRIETVLLGHQVPGQFDGHILKIVAERKVPEHFEKRMVAGRVADILEIVVLTTGTHAFLRCCCPVVEADARRR